LVVFSFVERQNWNAVLKLENVRVRSIIDQDHLAQVPVDNSKVFRVNVWMDLETVIAVKSMFDELFVRVDFVQDYIRVRLMTGRESDDFKRFGHLFQKTDRIWPDCDVRVGILAVLQFYWKDQVMGLCRLFFAMDDRFIDVDHQSFSLVILWFG
jgi:hypothetical protein